MSEAQAANPVTENGASSVQQTIEETPGFKVFAGNLSYSTTDEGLKAFFAPVQADILSAKVIEHQSRNGKRSSGYGFVALSTQEAVQKAVDALNKKELDGREVVVEVAKPAEQKDIERKERKAKRRPGRRGSKAVPGEVTDAEANGDAAKAEGAASEKPKKKKKAKTARVRAAVTDAADAVEGAVAPKKAKARKPRPTRAPRPAGEDPVGEPSKSMLFVANLGFNVDEAALTEIFTEAGIPVTSARIVRRRWGRPRKSKGYGFVDVSNEEQQKKAMDSLQGKEVGGRAIAVKVAVNTQLEEEAAAEEAENSAAAA